MSISDIGKKISGKTKELSQKAKIMSETNSLNNIVKGEEFKIDFQYKTIGKLYFEKFSSTPDPEFAEAIEIIKTSMDKIDQTKQEIVKIRSRFNCPSCGEPFKNGALFCSKCGTKLPEPEQPQVEIPANAQKCSKCGNILKKDAIFCNECGNKLTDETPTIEATATDISSESFAPAAQIETAEVVEVKSEELTPVETVEAKPEKEDATTETITEATSEVAEETKTEDTPVAAEEAADKKCSNCGNKIYDGDLFCNECGTKIE